MPSSLIPAIALIASLTLAAAEAPPLSPSYQPTPGTGRYTSTLDLEYANVGGESLTLDLHLPEGDGPFPVIVWLHTGAWVSGDTSGGPAVRQASRGYAVASVEYRLAPKWTFPAQIHDAKAAVRWLRANAARYKLDPERIGVFGASAGGHLAALLGTTADRPELEDLTMGNAAFSSSVKAVVDFYGPTDLLQLSAHALPCMPMNPDSPFAPTSLFIGCAIQDCKEKTNAASPIRYVSEDDAPFLILHGTADCLVPWQQSVLLHDALKRAGLQSSLHLLEGAAHGGEEFDQLVWKQTVSDFLDKYLKGSPRKRAVRRN
jgi:acetyl esterase/lipase